MVAISATRNQKTGPKDLSTTNKPDQSTLLCFALKIFIVCLHKNEGLRDRVRRTATTLTRLRGRAGWSGSSLFAHASQVLLTGYRPSFTPRSQLLDQTNWRRILLFVKGSHRSVTVSKFCVYLCSKTDNFRATGFQDLLRYKVKALESTLMDWRLYPPV